MVSESILCMAIAIFHESRGEIKKAQYAVAEVIHNRTKHPNYPDNYCGVVKDKGQFSFVKNQRQLRPPRYELEAWQKSIEVAKDFKQKKTDITKGAIYFNHVTQGVKYKTKVKSVKIGQHVFY